MENKKQNNKYNIKNLTPAIVQHFISGDVLMLGYMNTDSIKITKKSKYVTFFSRKTKRIWTKGEISGNKLKFISLHEDCDKDTILILAIPEGPTCHTGTKSCFNNATSNLGFLYKLEQIINEKKTIHPQNSYTARLYNEGPKKIAQKIGEEGVEVALASLSQDKQEITNEAADLLYHLLVLLQNQNINLNQVVDVLKNRHFIACSTK